MPWCETCAKFWNPNSMQPDGTCPSCGRSLAEAPEGSSSASGATGGPGAGSAKLDLRELAGEDARTPWHFKLLVVAVVGYLGWRGVEMASWVIHHL